MKHLYTFAIVFALIFSATSRPAEALNPSESAAITAGVLVGSAAAQVLSTRSSIVVTVEAYKDTLKRNNANVNSTVEERRTPPFRLGGPAAIRRLMEAEPGEISHAQLVRITADLKPYIQTLEQQASNLTTRTLAIKANAPESKTWGSVATDNERWIALISKASQHWGDLNKLVEAMSAQGAVRDGDLAAARVKAILLREALVEIGEFRLSESSVGLLQAKLRGAYYGARESQFALAASSDDADKILAETAYKGFNEAGAAAVNDTRLSRQLARLVTAAVAAKEQLSSGTDASKGFIAEANDTFNDIMQVNIGAISPEATLTEIESMIREELERQELLNPATAVAALTVAYGQHLVTANVGPLRNEMSQGLLAMNAELDEVLENAKDDNRWGLVNFVKSKGRLGNHNAVIYLENAATPMLKKAAFDPTEFIKASAAVHRQALSTATALFGLPGADSTNPYNAYNIQGRASKAEANLEQLRSELAASAVVLLQQHAKIKADANSPQIGLTPKLLTELAKGIEAIGN